MKLSSGIPTFLRVDGNGSSFRNFSVWNTRRWTVSRNYKQSKVS